MSEFSDRLRARILAEGSIGLDAYMTACNDHYYATRDPLGEAGDFVTAPEISQMFGELVGAVLTDVWLSTGAPGEAIFAELGPGRGTLALDALRVLRSGGFVGEVELVEASPVLRAVQQERLPDAVHREIGGLSAAPLLLVANEFLDALPIRQTIGGRERRVVIHGDGLGFDITGEVRETAPTRDEAVRRVAEHLVRHGGAGLIVDYGYRESAPGDSFQAVRGHKFVDPFADPGEQDLTAHVDFGAVARVAADAGALVTPVVSQGTFLERLGVAARAMALAAKNPVRGEEVVAARRRLCDAAEMGELFKVIAIHSPNWPEPAGFRG